MDKTTEIIYKTLSRHLLDAAEELRYTRFFEGYEYAEMTLREIYLIVQKSDLSPARKIEQIKAALEGLCPDIVEQANCLCAEDLQELLQEDEFFG